MIQFFIKKKIDNKIYIIRILNREILKWLDENKTIKNESEFYNFILTKLDEEGVNIYKRDVYLLNSDNDINEIIYYCVLVVEESNQICIAA